MQIQHFHVTGPFVLEADIYLTHQINYEYQEQNIENFFNFNKFTSS